MVDLLVKILNEYVALSSFTQGRITLRPHDTARRHVRMWRSRKKTRIYAPSTVLDKRIVERLEGALTVAGVKIVDVGIAEGTTGDGVAADTNAAHKDEVHLFSARSLCLPGDRTDHVKDLKEHSLRDGGVELSDVE